MSGVLWLIIGCGVVALIVMAVGAGMSLDTDAQRRAHRRVADERRRRAGWDKGDDGRFPPCSDCPWRHR